MVVGYLCIQCRERLKHARSGTISIWCHVRHWHPEWSQSTQCYLTWRGTNSTFEGNSRSVCSWYSAGSPRSPNLQEWWPRIFCKLQTSVSDINLLQGCGTHNPFPDNETLEQAQDPAQHTTWFEKEKFMRDAVVADSGNQTEPCY